MTKEHKKLIAKMKKTKISLFDAYMAAAEIYRECFAYNAPKQVLQSADKILNELKTDTYRPKT